MKQSITELETAKDGCCTMDEARHIAYLLKNRRNCLFSISSDDVTVLNVMLVSDYVVYGYVDNYLKFPIERMLVGIMHSGFFHLDPMNEQHPDYIGKKLGLGKTDAEAVTAMLNVVFSEYRELAKNEVKSHDHHRLA